MFELTDNDRYSNLLITNPRYPELFQDFLSSSVNL